ncbi:hypothetical protein D1825_05160 [Cellulomonas rhizosphaerae]|uniref:Uncharacterized protein n=1 Tax=Cellulomonas rhizosphaerae TaxID=2293719 RepID=A0A413RP22_9CELL|nr:hypothetical protein D1825_05160 [Cellulomonas rhizosphaerae]
MKALPVRVPKSPADPAGQAHATRDAALALDPESFGVAVCSDMCVAAAAIATTPMFSRVSFGKMVMVVS